jgi:hypothetical protein
LRASVESAIPFIAKYLHTITLDNALPRFPVVGDSTGRMLCSAHHIGGALVSRDTCALVRQTLRNSGNPDSDAISARAFSRTIHAERNCEVAIAPRSTSHSSRSLCEMSSA